MSVGLPSAFSTSAELEPSIEVKPAGPSLSNGRSGPCDGRSLTPPGDVRPTLRFPSVIVIQNVVGGPRCAWFRTAICVLSFAGHRAHQQTIEIRVAAKLVEVRLIGQAIA